VAISGFQMDGFQYYCIRVASIRDATVVYEVLMDNARWLASKGIKQWPVSWLEAIRPDIDEAISFGRFYIVEKLEQPVAVFELKTEPEAVWNYDEAHYVYIHKIAVMRRYAGLKIGASIIHSIQNMARRIGFLGVRLDCVEENRILRDYYKRLGFESMGTHKSSLIDLALYQLSFHSVQ